MGSHFYAAHITLKLKEIQVRMGHTRYWGEYVSSIGMPQPLQMFYGNLSELHSWLD